MKILIATPIYPPEIGGPATYVKELCSHLSPTHTITVVAYTDEHIAFPNTKLIAVSKQQSFFVRFPQYIWAVWKASKDADVIYVQNAMASGLSVALVSMMRGIPFVLKFVGDEAWERATGRRETTKRLEDFLEHPEGGLRTKLFMAIQGFVLRRASVVTTPSLYLSEQIIKTYGVDKKRAVVNYNAAEHTELENISLKRIPHQVATTARLTSWKGVDGIIRAIQILKQEIPDVRLVVAGDGPEMENLKKLVSTLGLSDSVTLLGNISRTETWNLRKNSEVYVLNSTYEGLPHTVLTSFDAEIPTIATNISGTNEAVYHEKTGLLVEPGDDRALAGAIKRLFADHELGAVLVHNAKNLLKEKFSWEAHIKTLNSILESVVTKPRN